MNCHGRRGWDLKSRLALDLARGEYRVREILEVLGDPLDEEGTGERHLEVRASSSALRMWCVGASPSIKVVPRRTTTPPDSERGRIWVGVSKLL